MNSDAEYVQLYRQMRAKVGNGEWAVGQQIPSLVGPEARVRPRQPDNDLKR